MFFFFFSSLDTSCDYFVCFLSSESTRWCLSAACVSGQLYSPHLLRRRATFTHTHTLTRVFMRVHCCLVDAEAETCEWIDKPLVSLPLSLSFCGETIISQNCNHLVQRSSFRAINRVSSCYFFSWSEQKRFLLDQHEYERTTGKKWCTAIGLNYFFLLFPSFFHFLLPYLAVCTNLSHQSMIFMWKVDSFTFFSSPVSTWV